MSQSNRLGDLLFWLMMLVGAAVLAPCLILPAWLEYRASVQLKTLRQEQVARRQAEVDKLRQQREQLLTDDAYALRLAREHLNVDVPGVERIPVVAGPVEPAEINVKALFPPEPDNEEIVPELAALIENLVQRYPMAQMFVRPETRPALMFIGGGLIITAIVFLEIWPRRPRITGKVGGPPL
ncbi:MAG: hypothetical protein ABIG44_02985 [Planctomycetota bacterium]